MKKIFKLFLFLGFLILFNISSVQAVTISFDPVAQTVPVGTSVDVDVVISGLGDYMPDSLGVFDLDVTFDTTILSFTGYQLGPYLGDTTFGEALDLSWGEFIPGVVNVAELSFLESDAFTCIFCIPPYLDDLQPSSFTLATLTFDTLALGTSPLELSIWSLGDSWGDPLVADVINGSIGSIAAVPEPATFLLLGSGLFGLGLMRQKFRG